MRRFASVSGIARALLWISIGSGLAVSTARGAGPPKPAPLSRFFPRQDLIVYAEFDGLDAHADLWRKTAAYRLLNETTTGAMLEDLALQLAGQTLAASPGQSLSAAELRTVLGHAVRSGFAFGIVLPPGAPQPSCAGLVLRGAARGKAREAIDQVLGAGKDPGSKTQTVDKPHGRKVRFDGEASGTGLASWTEGDDLAFSVGPLAGVDLMIEALDKDRPDATRHPDRLALARVEDGFTTVGRAFIDMTALPGLPPQAAAMGFDKVKRLDYRWGFQGRAVKTVTRVVVPAPRSGLLAAFDQPTFDRKGLPALPPGLPGFTTVSVDPASLYDRIAAGVAATNPEARARFEAFETAVRDLTGHRLRDDVLPLLGPKMTYYVVPTKGNAPANALAGFAQGLLLTPRAALVIELKDRAAFSRVLDDAMTRIEATFKKLDEPGARSPTVRLHRLKGDDRGYVLSFSPTSVPLPAGFRPTVVVGKSSLILASTPDAARGALAVDARGGGLPADDLLAETLGRLPGALIFVNVHDTSRSLFPDLIANLPGLLQWFGTTSAQGALQRLRMARPGMNLNVGGPTFRLAIDPDKVPAAADLRPFLFPSVFALAADDQGFQFSTSEAFPAFNPVALAPVAAALLVPATTSARLSARRSQSINNLKQIGLALHNYHSVNNHLPPGVIADKEGKPLLSWRVAILPYIEQAALYNEFHLDEPWDSAHNKPLIARMPTTYARPGAQADPGKTFYRGFSGESTVFDPKVKDGVGFHDVTDGTSNTLAIVEAKTAVTWTKPDQEIPFDPAPEKARNILKDLGGHSPGGFNALMLDGSVRFIKESINVNVLRALITRNGGEVISADAY